jgi:hypothetical protein
MAKIKEGADTKKDLKALELEVEEAAMEVMDNIDYEGNGGDQYSWARSCTFPSLCLCKTSVLDEHLLSRNETLCLLSMRAW